MVSLGGTHASQVLRVERAEGGPDRRTDPHGAFFQVWPK